MSELKIDELVAGLAQLGLYPKRSSSGPPGDSAYDAWLAEGNTGTVQDFLDSLVGEQGLPGTAGPPGADGKSAYQSWLDQGNTGSEQDFLDSLKGESEYQLWLDAGNSGTKEEWYLSMSEFPDTFTITQDMIDSKGIDLSYKPADPLKTYLDVRTGPRQWPNIDFTVDASSKRLSWDQLALELLLIVGDQVVVWYKPDFSI